jgi:hypothetical protein
MKQIALLSYMFLFDPSEGWSNGFQFEADLADFFAANGYEANLVQTQGNATARVLSLTKIQEAAPRLENQPETKTPQQVRTTLKKGFQMRDINFNKQGGK